MNLFSMRAFLSDCLPGLLFACLSALSSADQVVISEIMYHPPAGLPEFIEFANATRTPFDFADWQLKDGVEFDFPAFDEADAAAAFIGPYERFLVSAVTEAELRAAYTIPLNVRVFGPWLGSLDNGGESISLVDRNGVGMCSVVYGDRPPWPASADGAGHSLTLVDADHVIDSFHNWRASSRRYGTPGTKEVEEPEEPYSDPEVNLSDGIPFIEYGDTWKFQDQNQNLGTAWKEVGYDDSTWASGPALLGFESSGLPSPGIQTALLNSSPAAQHRVYYFRKTFVYSGETVGATVSVDQIVDDGAIYWLNGQQLGDGIGVPNGADWQTLANRTVGNAVEEPDVIVVNDPSLVSGTNTVAVELHQTSDTSSDVVFGARVKVSVPSELGVVINEVLPGTTGEGFVEFYNPTTNSVDLGGWYLSDDPGVLDQHAIPGSLPLLPGALVTVGYAESQLSLGDPTVVYLTRPDGETVVHAISSSLVLDGRSLGRKPVGSSSWFLFADSTPGQPNQSLPDLSDLSDQFRLNEVAYDSQDRLVWVEIHNATATSTSIDGLFLSGRRDFSDVQALSGTIAGTGTASWDTLIELEDDILYLVDAAGNVLDTAAVERRGGRPYSQVFPEGSGEWYAATNDTRNASNQPGHQADIVINEVLFDLPSGQSRGEFLELVNRGSATVDLSGWSFVDGISFSFPPGTTLDPGAFLVLAADAAWMQSVYGVQVAGEFGGELANKGERVRLVDAVGNLVDEIDYKVGGNWPGSIDGDGSSMELAHPDMDNDVASAWRDSDESSKAAWQGFSYVGSYEQLDSQGSASDYKELHFHLVGDAHLVLRNIVLSKDGTGPNLVQNGTVMTSTGNANAGWLAQGTHHATYMDNGELHLVSDGHGDNRANRAEIDIPNIQDNDVCTLSFEARWISGKPRLIAQTWDHSFGYPFLLEIPNNLGTPAAPNTALLTASAPELQDLQHSPAVPDSTQAVRVTARVSSADALGSVALHHRPDSINGAEVRQSTGMFDDGATGGDEVAGDGVYTATLNQYQANNQVVQFYVRAVANGIETLLPK
ncbi:MAG: lamin tail domain-containing protein, partial [Verrucomicrobiota bacterium]